jgi:phage gp46-like protein
VLALRLDETLAESDLTVTGSSLVDVPDGDLETMVSLSLFCDAPARDGDVTPAQDPSGYWADSLGDGDVWGSRIWLLRRAKLIQSTKVKLKQYAEEALAWMLADGLASKIEVTADIRSAIPGVRGLYLAVDIAAPNERNPKPFGPWLVLRGDA